MAGILVLGFVLAASGFVFAASKESHDPFCASCHTQPESTFFERSLDVDAVDLASFHTQETTRCIDCHSGPGVLGRMRAELMGARNALAWFTHTAMQPAPLTVPIRDENCLKCHQDVIQRGYSPKHPLAIVSGDGHGEREGEEDASNHWHELLARWQAYRSDAGTCTSCHAGHTTDGTAETGYENAAITRAVCEACHRVMGD
ncbi:MAG: hypothetical protein P8Y98_08220 [Anaerolineales bacterium]